ncbi:MAG TPA: murein biosynthesis integral membrane protein MurJ [Phenylobacterium sp.]|uniref:murein biosynthesis integral membrane protein MurJ n=1 Tax=Phenylobacterium sp. TaxID=1871053 RepID=UPI002B49A5FA|nr:murein biosynthesis integral membrane protein MurJ [Phenylobacterium sp.]HKR86616.1 murein biosynthesis integral membrane protein MurJ [Phenylobacterium sp.]
MTETPLTATKPASTPASAKGAAKPGGLIRSSMVYSSFTLISRVMGFVRDLAVSYHMGASATFAADAFNTAFAFPNLFRRIFAEGAFAAAFVPAYSKSLERDGEHVADELAADAMATLAAATLAITLIAELTMPWLMHLIAPGFAANPQKFHLAVVLTMITMPYLPCMAIYAHLSGVLNARNRFILSAAAPILLNIWTLVTVLPTRSPVQAAIWASVGVLLAGVSQAALLAWGCKRSGAHVGFRWPRLTPEIKQLIMLAVPGAIAASATQINIFISGVLVSQVNGARSWLAYCDRLYQLPQGLVGVAIGVALLPRLSRAVHAGDHASARSAMDEAITFAMALTLPAAAALVAIPYFMVDALYTRGAFTNVDAEHTAAALLNYGWGVPAFVLAQLFSRAFFARQDTKTPMRYGLIAVVVNVGLGVTLFQLVGVSGIAAATAAAWWLNVAMMAVTLARRGDYRPSPKAVSKLIRILIASVALGAVLGAVSHFRAPIETVLGHASFGPIHGKELAIAVTAVLALGLYPLLLFASGGLTLAEARAAVRRRKG